MIKRVASVFIFVGIGILSFFYYSRYLDERQATAELIDFLAAPKTLELNPRTKTADCILHGALPDPGCTPGAIIATATLQQICVPGYTTTVRSVSTKTRKAVFAEYNLSYPAPRRSVEVDHLIPLALGGSNDIANLFPEPAEPTPGFKEKDVVEDYLHEKVCAGEIDLNSSREKVAHDWLYVYSHLTPDEISAIKAKYSSWTSAP